MQAGRDAISPSRTTIRSSLRFVRAERRSLPGSCGSRFRSPRTMSPGVRSLEAANRFNEERASLCLSRATLWDHPDARQLVRVARREPREARCKRRSARILQRSSRQENRAPRTKESVPPCFLRSTQPKLRVSPWRFTAKETRQPSTNKNVESEDCRQSRQTCSRLAATSHLRPRPHQHGAGHRPDDDGQPFLSGSRSDHRDGPCGHRGAPDSARRSPGEERGGRCKLK